MFGKIASELLGISDIGRIIDKKDFDKVDTDDYILKEDNETVYFLIKSKTDEYCFTNLGLLHLDGTSAVSKKRMLYRYDYKTSTLKNVKLETAGTIDLDVEIKFNLADEEFSIDITKNQLNELTRLYKTLLKIASIQHENLIEYNTTKESLDLSRDAVSRCSSPQAIENSFKQIYSFTYMSLKSAKDKCNQKDFADVYKKYLEIL